MTDQVLEALGKHGVTGESVRLVDLDVKPGVEKDMGEGDAWPAIRPKLLAADILVLATPTWMGHLSSVAQRAMERLDAELSETDDEGRLETFGKVAVTVVVGNEDGGHAITADLFGGPRRRRLHDPGQRRRVLERGGDDDHRLQGPRRDARGRRLHHGDAGGQRGAPGHAAEAEPLPAGLTRGAAHRPA
jgi:hypothetical protein